MTRSLGALWPLMLAQDKHGLAELCAVSAKGVRVRFADGRELLCGTSGLWNCPLGYGNQAIANAIATALCDASYLSVWDGENTYAREAARVLVELAGSEAFGRVMFSTSGGAANDMVMKLARHYQVLKGESGKNVILGLQGGYHGLTYGAFALTSSQLGQRLYCVDRRLVGHTQPNDQTALEKTLERIGDRVAAIVIEPVIGTGAIPLEDAYIRALCDQRRKYGYLLVADEVTTGFWRTGPRAFASQEWPEPPDVIITAKGLTNGTLAASALVVAHSVSQAFADANAVLGHAETQAGTSVVCAAILATLSEMRVKDVASLSCTLSDRLDEELACLASTSPAIQFTTGKGCLRSIGLAAQGRSLTAAEVDSVVDAIRRAGALVHAGPSCVQILPALVYSTDDLRCLVSAIRTGLDTWVRIS